MQRHLETIETLLPWAEMSSWLVNISSGYFQSKVWGYSAKAKSTFWQELWQEYTNINADILSLSSNTNKIVETLTIYLFSYMYQLYKHNILSYMCYTYCTKSIGKLRIYSLCACQQYQMHSLFSHWSYIAVVV